MAEVAEASKGGDGGPPKKPPGGGKEGSGSHKSDGKGKSKRKREAGEEETDEERERRLARNRADRVSSRNVAQTTARIQNQYNDSLPLRSRLTLDDGTIGVPSGQVAARELLTRGMQDRDNMHNEIRDMCNELQLERAHHATTRAEARTHAAQLQATINGLRAQLQSQMPYGCIPGGRGRGAGGQT